MTLKFNGKPGDRVKVLLTTQEYDGILVEAPQSEKGIVLLKLDSGYNIGLIRKDIREIKVLEKSKPEDKEGEVTKIKAGKDEGKPSVAMIITGGTISSQLDPKSGAVKWLTSPGKLLKFYPGLFEHVNVAKVEVPFMKDSGEMDFKDWQKIARVAEKLLNDSNIKGLIITHGTDTLHYTAAALSFFLGNLSKPVVLTYSQRSTDRASSDAALNLECAAIASLSDIGEVTLVGHADSSDDVCNVLRGTKVRKLHSSRRDAFKPVNDVPIGRVEPEKGFIRLSDYKTLNRKRGKGKIKADVKFEPSVALLKFYPGQDSSILDYYVKNKYKGIVIEVFGLGQIASHEARKAWAKKLKEVQKRGLIVCAAAQTIYGRLDPLVYSTGRELLDTGMIYLEDMLAETAFVKLGWILGHKEWAKDKEKVKELMLTNIAGELNNRLEN